MKPMIALITFGVITLGITFYLGKNSFDGVVEDKTYEASLSFDKDTKNANIMEKAFSNIKFNNDDKSISFDYNPEKAIDDNTVKTTNDNSEKITYSNAVIQSIKLVRPVGKSEEFVFTKDNNKYMLNNDTALSKGWYYVKFLCVADNNSIVVTKNLYID